MLNVLSATFFGCLNIFPGNARAASCSNAGSATGAVTAFAILGLPASATDPLASRIAKRKRKILSFKQETSFLASTDKSVLLDVLIGDIGRAA